MRHFECPALSVFTTGKFETKEYETVMCRTSLFVPPSTLHDSGIVEVIEAREITSTNVNKCTRHCGVHKWCICFALSLCV